MSIAVRIELEPKAAGDGSCLCQAVVVTLDGVDQTLAVIKPEESKTEETYNSQPTATVLPAAESVEEKGEDEKT
ncbi:MAG TPA: hypothetical protein VMW04_00785 [Patescibacteria group bacterium]|nr:hypothetical protein [Patescibacteria group bacterium]